MPEKQTINQGLDPSKEVFYANGFALFIQGNECYIDFRQTMSRVDETPNGVMRSIVAKHQPIVFTPQIAKNASNNLERANR